MYDGVRSALHCLIYNSVQASTPIHSCAIGNASMRLRSLYSAFRTVRYKYNVDIDTHVYVGSAPPMHVTTGSQNFVELLCSSWCLSEAGWFCFPRCIYMSYILDYQPVGPTDMKSVEITFPTVMVWDGMGRRRI